MALLDNNQNYEFGDDDALARKRKIAEMLLYGQSKPVTNWAEGLNELAKGYVGGKLNREADAKDSEWQKGLDQTLAGQLTPQSGVSQALGGNQASTTPQSFGGGDKDAFVKQFMPLAMQASQKTGVDPNIIVAQAALESGWGKSAPNNNYFGIKGEGQKLPTTEVVNGQPVETQASFKGFNSPEDSVNGYADFINKNPRYAPLKNAQGMDAQLAALQQSGYATDPQYGSKVGSIAKSLMGEQSSPQAMSDTQPPQQQVAQNDPKAQIAQMLQSPNPRVRKLGEGIAQKLLANQLESSDAKYGEIGQDQFGNKTYGWIDSKNRTITPVSGQQNSQTPQADLNTTGEDFLKTLDKPTVDQVKALAEGRMQFPAGAALKTPYWQKMLQNVGQYDPTFDAINYNARSKTRNDFTSGKSAQSINALNTVMGHLETLSDSADALKNTSIPAWNTVANLLETAKGDPRVKKFEATKKAVVDELTRAYRGAGGSEADIKTWSSTIDSAGSPEQLHGVIGQVGDLLESKITALGEQYKQGMGTTKEDIQLVSPKARATLDKLKARAVGENQDQPKKSIEPPKAGDIEDGHQFKGGDPSDPNNWVPVT